MRSGGPRELRFDSGRLWCFLFARQGFYDASHIEGQGDKLMRDKQQKDLNEGARGSWNGRRKGVVEFVDRTHSFAVNQNKQFLDTCAAKPHSGSRR